MSDEERRAWDDRYRSGDYTPRPRAGRFLEDWIDRLPPGRSLDVACGAGRHALRLAEAGHRVDAIDISEVAVAMARSEANRRGLDINWMVADLDDYDPPAGAYDVITVIRYVNRRLWPRLAGSLAPGGWLLVEHHLNTTAEVDGPSSPAFRLDSQELLRAFAELQVLLYQETLEPADRPGAQYALARLVARRDGSPG